MESLATASPEQNHWVAEFIRHIQRVRRLSAHTVLAYERDLNKLLAGLQSIAPEAATAVDLRRLVVADKKSKATTVSRQLASWRAFYDYLLEREVVSANPARSIMSPKTAAPLPKSLTPDEMHALLSVDLQKQNNLGLRDCAMMELFYSSALRLSELVALDIGDVDINGGFVYVKQGKGGKGRVAPVGAGAQKVLKQWLAARDKLLLGLQQNPPAALFINRSGARLSARTIQKRLQHHAQRLGLTQSISPHMLRHSCASHFLQSSHDLRATQELLGHRNIATTQIYTRLDYQHLAEIYDKAHPRARNKPAK